MCVKISFNSSVFISLYKVKTYTNYEANKIIETYCSDGVMYPLIKMTF